MIANTRKEALANGCDFYASSKKCPNGNIAPRATVSCNCTCDECRQQKSKRLVASRQASETKKEAARLAHKKWRQANADDERERCRQWRLENPSYSAKHYQENRATKLAFNKQWNKDNSDRLAELAKLRRATPEGKAVTFCRNMVMRCISQSVRIKDARCKKILGYTPNELIDHITPLLKDGMTWSNYGQWHVDHIKPVSLFFKEGITDPSLINALANLQPLWANDNMAKGCRYEQN